MPDQPFLAGPGRPGLVTVVIATYNRAAFLGAAIASALAQTYRDVEVVVADDGSTDRTAEVVAGFDDPRVRYLALPHGGMSAARNAALDETRGEFVAFLDSDDEWMPWKIEAQLALFARHPSVGMIWTDMAAVDGDEVLAPRHLRSYYHAYASIDLDALCPERHALGTLGSAIPAEYAGDQYHIGDIFGAMLSGNIVHPPTAVVRRSRLQQSGGFDTVTTGHGAEDYHFYFKIAEHGPVALMDAPSIRYRIHPGQLSTTNSGNEAKADLRVIRHWIARHPGIVSRRAERARLAATYRWLGGVDFETGDRRAAAAHLAQSLRLDPLQPVVAARLAASLLPASAVHRLRQAKRFARTSPLRRGKVRLAILSSGLAFLLYEAVSFVFSEIATSP